MEVVLSTTRDAGVFAHDLQTAAPVQRFRDGATSGAGTTPVGADSAYFLSALTHKALVHFWRWGKEQPMYRVSTPERLTATATTSDGALLVAGGVSGKLYVWHLSTGALLRCVEAHYRGITSVRITEDDALVVTTAEDALANVFVLSTLIAEAGARPLQTLAGHGLSVTSAAVTPGGAHASVVTSSLDRSVKVWDVVTGRLRRDFLLPAAATQVAVSSDGRSIFAAANDGRAYALRVEESNAPAAFEGHRGALGGISLSADGRTLATCAASDAVRVWDVGSRQCVTHMHACFHSAAITGVSILRRSAAPTPLPEFRPLQRVVALEPTQPVPVLAKRALGKAAATPAEFWLDFADDLEARSEAAALRARVAELEAREARWAAAALALAEAPNSDAPETPVASEEAPAEVPAPPAEPAPAPAAAKPEAAQPVPPAPAAAAAKPEAAQTVPPAATAAKAEATQPAASGQQGTKARGKKRKRRQQS